MIIAISLPIESQNKWVGRAWFLKHQATKNWEIAIWEALRGKIKKADVKVSMKITSYRKRLLDFGNLVGGCKPILDAMKRLNLIVDDSPKWLECEYVQKIQKSGPGTVIEIKEIQ